MTDRTLTAMYDTRGAAETARDQLIELGVAVDAISIRGMEGERDSCIVDYGGRGSGLLGEPQRSLHAG